MPITIRRIMHEGQKNEEVAWLCDDCWRLPDQGKALAAWLAADEMSLRPAEYIADVGFAYREDALGGGAAFSPETLRRMADLGMALFISEYPCNDVPATPSH